KLKTTTAALLIAGLLAGGLLLSGALIADPSTTPHAALAQQATDQSQDEAPDKGTAKKGREKLKLRATLEGHSKAVQDVAFSPDGKVLAAGFLRIVKLWHTATGKALATIKNEGSIGIHDTCLLAFSPDGKTLVMGTGAFGGVEAPIHLWNWSENKPNGTLKTD